MPSPQLQNIGLALQGLGAGLGGQLPQFLQSQDQRVGLEAQIRQQDAQMQMQTAEKQQQMAIERKKTMYTDANAALKLLDSGNVDGVIQLGINRLQLLKQLSQFDPSIDPSDTQRVTQLALAARNGDEEAKELLRGELASTVQVGQAIGVIEPEQDEIIPNSSVSETGQVMVRSPGGAIKAMDIPGFKAAQTEKKMDFMQRVMPDGSIQTVMTDPQGNFFNLEGGSIQVGANERLIEGTTLSGGMDDLGIGNAEARQMRDAEVATRSFMATALDALNLLNQEPDINTFTAAAAGTINNLQQEAKALARNVGVEFDESLLDPSKYSGTFDRLGIQNARMKSMVTSLAYTQALANNPDGRVSNADLTRAIEEVGGSAADPRAFAKTLMDVAQRTDRRFKIDYETRFKKPFDGDTGFSALSGFQGANATVTTQAEYDALPSGAIYLEDGVEYRKP